MTISLENFDRLMFCTDRLIEARNDKDMEFGTVGLKKACMAARAGRSSEILEATIRQWRAYCGDVAAIDDLCLVVAEVPA